MTEKTPSASPTPPAAFGALKHLLRLRVYLFLLILLLALIFSISHPPWLDSYYGNSDVHALTRLWFFASVLATLILVFPMNFSLLEKAKQITDVLSDESLDEHKKAFTQLKRCTVVNQCLILAGTLTLILIGVPSIDLKIGSLFAGIVLVTFMFIFDLLLHDINCILLRHFQGIQDDSSSAAPQGIERLMRQCRESRDLAMKLDLPVLMGVAFTWIVGFVILPEAITADVAHAYSYGFASGATALQLSVGTLMAEIIHAAAAT